MRTDQCTSHPHNPILIRRIALNMTTPCQTSLFHFNTWWPSALRSADEDKQWKWLNFTKHRLQVKLRNEENYVWKNREEPQAQLSIWDAWLKNKTLAGLGSHISKILKNKTNKKTRVQILNLYLWVVCLSMLPLSGPHLLSKPFVFCLFKTFFKGLWGPSILASFKLLWASESSGNLATI